MSERRWDALSKKIEPQWGADRERAVRGVVAERTARRRATTMIGASFVVAAVAGGGVFWALRARDHVHPAATAQAPAVPLPADAAVAVTQLLPETVIEPMPDRKGRGFTLRKGGARFVAPHDPEHPVTVVAGDVVIEDLGTTFTVSYVGDDRLEVAVEQGRVQVRAHGTATELGDGERRTFALEATSPPASGERAPRVQAPPASSSWRPLAESGRYDEAHAALQKAGPNAVRDDTGDLLLAADAARLSAHPAEAVPYLERVVRSHGSDPRAGLAAFTLGRVLLDELGRPREAADAFARARAAGGPLAEDALARQVEAASRAGDTARSRELAREYIGLYPKGRRMKAVTRFGGLD